MNNVFFIFILSIVAATSKYTDRDANKLLEKIFANLQTKNSKRDLIRQHSELGNLDVTNLKPLILRSHKHYTIGHRKPIAISVGLKNKVYAQEIDYADLRCLLRGDVCDRSSNGKDSIQIKIDSDSNPYISIKNALNKKEKKRRQPFKMFQNSFVSNSKDLNGRDDLNDNSYKLICDEYKCNFVRGVNKKNKVREDLARFIDKLESAFEDNQRNKYIDQLNSVAPKGSVKLYHINDDLDAIVMGEKDFEHILKLLEGDGFKNAPDKFRRIMLNRRMKRQLHGPLPLTLKQKLRLKNLQKQSRRRERPDEQKLGLPFHVSIKGLGQVNL